MSSYLDSILLSNVEVYNYSSYETGMDKDVTKDDNYFNTTVCVAKLYYCTASF